MKIIKILHTIFDIKKLNLYSDIFFAKTIIYIYKILGTKIIIIKKYVKKINLYIIFIGFT